MGIPVGSEEFASLPKAVERRDDRARNDNFQNLLHKVLIEARTRGQLAKILQSPRHFADKDLHRERLFHHFQMRQKRLIVKNCRVLVLERLYEELIVGGRVHVAQIFLRVRQLLLETSADFQPKLIHVRVDDDGLEADTEGAENERRHEDDDARVLLYAPADFEEMWLKYVTQVDWGTTAVRFALQRKSIWNLGD